MNRPIAGLVETPVHQLSPGMYVAELDRPWLESPFMVQGFYVQDDDDIQQVADVCEFVFIDPRRQERSKRYKPRASVNAVEYRNRVSMREEYNLVAVNYDSASTVISKTFENLRTTGRLDVGGMRQALDPVIDSVLRNNEAATALARIKRKNDYLFNHSLATAVWASVLGRQIGLPKQELGNLALGAALIDVGMTVIPDEILNKSGPLEKLEHAKMRRHVERGIDLLSESGEANPDVVEIVLHHHERHDGSGYPNGVSGLDIPLFARIVGIADSYDAMITSRPHASPRTSFEAVLELRDLAERNFQSALIEQFVQAIGLFPTGSIVQLSNGCVGIVVVQNTTRRLKPKVIVVLNKAQKRLPEPVMIDLAKYAGGDERTEQLWIERELPPGAHGINESEYFL